MDTFLIELTELFHWTVRASGYAIVIIGVIVLAQMLLHRRLPAGWTYALWLILLARLVLPSGPSSSLSLWNLLPQQPYETRRAFSEETSKTRFLPAKVKQMPDAGEESFREAPGQPISSTMWEALPVIWLGGVWVMLGGILVKNLRLWLSVRKLRQATHQPVLELLEDCKQAMHVRTIIGLAFTGRVQSPALFGCLRPRILLPEHLAGQIPLEELRCIFLHELAHLKRGDLWLSWLVAVLQALHWFNPLLWWAFARMRADREAAADAMALRRLPGGGNERYADTIVNLLEDFTRSPRLPVIAAIVENKTQIKRRLTMITRFKPPRRIETLVAVALVALLAMATLSDAQDSVVVPVQTQIAGHTVPWTPAYISADKFRVGAAIQASRLVFKTEPVYPENARAAGISGETSFEVTVDGEGNVIDIWSVKGNPLLADAAAEAIRQWRYVPTHFNDSPVSVTFPVIVDFMQDGTVAMAFESKTNPPQNQFLNIGIPSILDDDAPQDSGILASANTAFRTFEGRRYLLMGQGMTAAVVDIDMKRLRKLADAGWPAESDLQGGGTAPLVVRVFTNKDGGVDGIAQEYGPMIPAIDDMLMHIRILSPAMFGTQPVPSHLRFEILPPPGIAKALQFVRPTVIAR